VFVKKQPLKRRVLIVGEGRETEYNYFVGFRNVFEDELEATATSVSVVRGKGGDARNIVENAIKQANRFKPNRKLGDRVFLLLDTEGAGREPELPAAEKLAENNKIEIVYSSPSLEFWLRCHFPKSPRRHFDNCDTLIIELNKQWGAVCKTEYDKADKDIFDRLSDRLDLACEQALGIDLHNMTTHGSARRVNPSSQVYELIAILVGVQSGKKCPIQGRWEPISDDKIPIHLTKGGNMPSHNDTSVKWQFSRR
jgi:RloB-like protein